MSSIILFDLYSSLVKGISEYEHGCKCFCEEQNRIASNANVLTSTETFEANKIYSSKSYQEVISEFEDGYNRMMEEYTDGCRRLIECQQSFFSKLDSNVVVSILMFTADCVMDVLVFSFINKSTRAIVMNSGNACDIYHKGHLQLVLPRLHKLCEEFHVPFNVLKTIMQEYKASLSAESSVFCLMKSFYSEDDSCKMCGSLELYLPFDEGMKFLQSIEMTGGFKIFPALLNFGYKGINATVITTYGRNHSPIMGLSIESVVTFAHFASETSGPTEGAKRIKFFILKKSCEEDMMSRCLSFMDFNFLANLITFEDNRLTVCISSAHNIIARLLVSPVNYVIAHRSMYEYCDLSASYMTFQSTRGVHQAFGGRRKWYESLGFKFKRQRAGIFLQMRDEWAFSGSAHSVLESIHEHFTDAHYMASDFDADSKLYVFNEYFCKHPIHATIQDSRHLHTPAHIAAYTGNVLLLNLIVDIAPEVVLIRSRNGKYCDDCLPTIIRLMHKRRFQTRSFDDTVRLIQNYMIVKEKILQLRKRFRGVHVNMI